MAESVLNFGVLVVQLRGVRQFWQVVVIGAAACQCVTWIVIGILVRWIGRNGSEGCVTSGFSKERAVTCCDW